MDNLGFDKKSTSVEQITTEDSNRISLELKQDYNTDFLKGHTTEILPNVIRKEVEVGSGVKSVLKQKLEDTVTDYPMKETEVDTLDVLVPKEALGIDITTRYNLTGVAPKEEIESTVFQTESFIIQNTLIENNDEQEQVGLAMEQKQTGIGTQNETHDSIIDSIVGLEYVGVLMQKESLEIDINIQKTFTEDARKKDIESAVPQSNSFTSQNIHTENIHEHTEEVSTVEQPQTSMSTLNEANDCKVVLESAFSEGSTSRQNAERECDVLETIETVQNVLVSEVKKLDISEKNANRRNESEVIVKNNSQSLKNLLVYSDEDEYDDGESNDVKIVNDKKLTVSSSDSESDSDSDSDSDPESSESDDSSSESDFEASKKNIATSKITSKTIEEQYTADLPQVADLSKLEVDYEKEEFLHIGEISGIIETIVTITTISGTPVYDLGSILFIEDNASKKPLGEIYDVIGPVSSPVYCIGFKSAKEIKELGIKPKMKVYSAPNSRLSHYVFLKQLLEAKYTDAGLSDEELSSDEYISDSGDERLPQKRKLPISSKKSNEHHQTGNTRGRGRQTMKHLNYRNRQVEAKEFRGWHTQNAVGARQQTSNAVGARQQTPFASNFSGVQTTFNPSVPPPLFQNNSSWITPPNTHPPPSWNNGDSNNGPRPWIAPPNLRTPPPQWNNNPGFNGVPNMPPPPPPHWNSCPRLGFPPNVRPPQRFAGYQQNTPSDPRRNYRVSYPANPYSTAPPRWQSRTHPYRPIRYGSSFPNASPMTSSNQSFNIPGKDVQ